MSHRTLTVRGIPDATLKRLRSRASVNHRSLNGELLVILDAVAAGGAPVPSRPTMVREPAPAPCAVEPPCDVPLVESVDRVALAEVCRRHHVRWLALFGSQARGDGMGCDGSFKKILRYSDPRRRGTGTSFRVPGRSSPDAAQLPPRVRRDDTMAMPVTRHFTAADLATMPDDGQRYELVRGELLVSPSPSLRHQAIVTRLYRSVLHSLERDGLADQLLMVAADLTLATDTVVQPDLFVADMAAGFASGQWTDVTDLFLVVEVISPSTARADRTLKRLAYQAQGIPQCWIVDHDLRQVEVWTPDAHEPVIVRDQLVWRHPALTCDCVIDLVRLFDFG